MTQTEQIEEYLKLDDDFPEFQQQHCLLFGSDAIDNTSQFFSNSFIDAHFRFASLLLERICRLNARMQEQNAQVHEVWESVLFLRQQFETDLHDMESGLFGKFTYVGGLNRAQRATFVSILKRFILNINIRFPCINTSVNKRIAGQNTNLEMLTLNQALLDHMRRACPFMLIAGVFLFPNDLIKHQMVNRFFIGGRYPEIDEISREILRKKDEILRTVQTSVQTRQGQTQTITLLDVFKVIDKSNFPFLWEVVVRTLAVLPTTVSCEQCFSRLKHRLHENMLKENAFCFLRMVQQLTSWRLNSREEEQ